MRSQLLLLSLLIAAPFAAAGNLECNQVEEGVPAIYRCVYHNGSLAQAYAALRANRSEDEALRLDHPHLPHTLPDRSFHHRSQDVFDYDGDGKTESYPVELSVKRPSPDRVVVQYEHDSPASPYSRETLFQRKGRNVEITIKRYAS
ncbi:hypothetical protein H9Q10_02735 [Eikenella sp. S3360]|uniref:Uncharacterized protein n=1 Tax=Eikenella glucosivorans TaxID=2766967 RepID=A0ABS0N8G0_9NEIS|nr:hypothetical protein [Eikenella glucosivorans]MBH5328587.1 hypothetical protein [Eikenella glucosivorans]